MNGSKYDTPIEKLGKEKKRGRKRKQERRKIEMKTEKKKKSRKREKRSHVIRMGKKMTGELKEAIPNIKSRSVQS